MASTEQRDGDRRGAPPDGGAAPAPADCRITLLTFVPYVLRDPAPAEHAHPVPAVLPALDDLRLWDYSGPLADRLRERLPHRVVRVEVPDGRAPAAGAPPRRPAVVDAWSFGVGLATFVDDRPVATAATWEDVRDDLLGRSAKEDALARTTPVAQALPATDDGPLWAQQMLVVEAPETAVAASLEEVARRLCPDGEQLAPATGPGGAALRLGAEACAVTRGPGVEVRDALARVVATQTAIWAAALDFDFQLLDMLDKDPRKLSLHELEARSVDLLTLFERVQRFRAEIEMIPLHLAGGDKAAWDAVNGVWRLNDQLSSLDTSLNACEHVYAHSATSLTTRQGRFLNGVVLAVTMLSLATFGLTAWDFTQKQFDAFDWISLLVVVSSLVLSVVLFHQVWTRATGRRLVLVRRDGPDPSP
jgi:hypothetical protein